MPRTDPTVAARGAAGIVGCGGVTRATVGALLEAGGRVAWVADPDPDARARVIALVAEHQDASPVGFADLSSALREGGADAPVVINSPAGLHLAHVRECASAGRPMLVAKPLALDWDDARSALSAAEAAGVSVAVAEQYPLEAHVRQLRGLIERHGPVRRVMLDHRKPASGQTTLAGKDQTGILEYAVHHYAVLASWLGRLPLSIAVDSWTSDGGRSGRGSVGHSWIHYDDCHVLHAFGFGGAVPTYRAELELAGGAVTATGSHLAAPDVRLELVVGGARQPVAQEAGEGDPWTLLYSRWLSSSAERTPAAGRREMLIVAAMVDAALRAATRGSVVELVGDARYDEVR